MVVNTIKKVMETYSNIYFPDINKVQVQVKNEKFDDNDYDLYNDGYSCTYIIVMTIVSWLVTGFAAYLSFKCSSGFSLGPFLLAILFSPIYIIYHIFATKLCGIMN